MAIEKEYTLKLSTEQAQSNVDELNKSLELQESLIDDIEKEISQYEKQINKTSKTDLAGRKKLNDQIKKSKERLKDEKIALKDLNKDRKKANEQQKEATENAADYSGVLSIVDQKTGGLISGMKNLTGGIGGATKGFNLLKVAIIGTGIGALLIAITAVASAFTSSESGQNKYAKIMGVIGSVVGNLVDILSDLGEVIISVFEDPKQAIIDFKDFIVQNITNRFNAAIDTVGFLGSAIKKVFSGDFSGAMADAKSAGSSYIDTLTGVENTIGKVTEATKNLVNEIVKEGKIAAQIADQRAKADILERGLIIERAEANRKRAELLEKAADKEKFSALERIEFLTEAGKLEEEITNKEIEAARLRLNAKTAENALSKSTKEDLDEEARLKAELINLEASRLTKQKLVTSQIVAAKREEIARLKEIEDEEKARKAEEAELEKVKQAEEDKAEKIRLDKILKDKKDRLTEEERVEAAMVAFKKQLQTQNLNNISAGFGLLSQLAGKNKGLQAAAIIGESAVNVARSVIETQSSNIAITAQGAALAIPSGGTSIGIAAKLVTANTIGAGIGIAANIAATAKALSALGKGGSPPSQQIKQTPPISVSTQESQPPAFNIVGASGTNQLADAIGGQSQQPVQAFVVSSEVTTSQELDRNIIDEASIGG